MSMMKEKWLENEQEQIDRAFRGGKLFPCSVCGSETHPYSGDARICYTCNPHMLEFACGPTRYSWKSLKWWEKLFAIVTFSRGNFSS